MAINLGTLGHRGVVWILGGGVDVVDQLGIISVSGHVGFESLVLVLGAVEVAGKTKGGLLGEQERASRA